MPDTEMAIERMAEGLWAYEGPTGEWVHYSGGPVGDRLRSKARVLLAYALQDDAFIEEATPGAPVIGGDRVDGLCLSGPSSGPPHPASPPECGFCKGKPVGNARSWTSGERLPALPCPRCGVLTPYLTPDGKQPA